MKEYTFKIPDEIYDFMVSEYKKIGFTMPLDEYIHTILSSTFTIMPLQLKEGGEGMKYMEEMSKVARKMEVELLSYLDKKEDLR